jgi:hypothetical protein
MVYNTRNYLVFGLFPLSGILGSRKHDVSETGSVSVLRCVCVCVCVCVCGCGGEDTYSVGSLRQS